MSRFTVHVAVHLRDGIADPQGATIERALPALGFDDVSGVRSGKAFWLDVDAESPEAAAARADELCRRFLTNPVIESATVTVLS
ncbi:MAG TPA: phosphoribosylformylglycinamidine synthase subunit PurS [Acidimicrobiales bacterium]|nr:phosphoribosylformylglycinamidine synthase subunit PurS [Acidimicrobiales bacterium]